MNNPHSTHLSIGYSKPYSIVMLLLVSAFGAIWYLFPVNMPTWARYAGLGLALLLALSCLRSLRFSTQVVVTNDEGLRDRRLGLGVIKWEDILAFRHVPRVEKVGHKTGFSLREEWRPVMLWVKHGGGSFRANLHSLARHPTHPKYPSALPLVIDFSGLNASSAEFAQHLRLHAPHADEVA